MSSFTRTSPGTKLYLLSVDGVLVNELLSFLKTFKGGKENTDEDNYSTSASVQSNRYKDASFDGEEVEDVMMEEEEEEEEEEDDIWSPPERRPKAITFIDEARNYKPIKTVLPFYTN
jgi:hypothetical protein